MLQLITVMAIGAAKQAAQTLVRSVDGQSHLLSPRRNAGSAVCNAEPITRL